MERNIFIELMKEYPEWHDQPLRLNNEQMENPMSVIKELFEQYPLKELRIRLRYFYHDAIETSNTPAARNFELYDTLELMTEVMWSLHVTMEVGKRLPKALVEQLLKEDGQIGE